VRDSHGHGQFLAVFTQRQLGVSGVLLEMNGCIWQHELAQIVNEFGYLGFHLATANLMKKREQRVCVNAFLPYILHVLFGTLVEESEATYHERLGDLESFCRAESTLGSLIFRHMSACLLSATASLGHGGGSIYTVRKIRPSKEDWWCIWRETGAGQKSVCHKKVLTSEGNERHWFCFPTNLLYDYCKTYFLTGIFDGGVNTTLV
jgi:hypothetical protein